MSEPSPAPTEPTEPTPEPPKVENPEAVLAKNKELLGKLASAKQIEADLAARVKAYEDKEAAEEAAKLTKKGDFDKLADRLKAENEAKLTEANARYEKRFKSDAEKELKLAIIDADAHEDEGTVDVLATYLLAKKIQPTDEDGVTVWRTLDGEQVELKDFIPTLKTTHGRHFKSDNISGGDAPGNKGSIPASLKRSTMTVEQKSAYITKHGQEAYLKLPN
jgi:membrane protein involved in colicin uptake